MIRQSVVATYLTVLILGTSAATSSATPQSFTAAPLGPGQTVTSGGDGGSSRSEGAYRFRAVAGASINITVTAPCGAADANLYRPDSEQTYADRDGVVSYTAPTGGDYYLYVTGPARCPYSFVMPTDGILPPVTTIVDVPEAETNRGAESPYLLQPDVRYQSVLETTNDEDWLTFYGRKGQIIVADFAGSNDRGCDLAYGTGNPLPTQYEFQHGIDQFMAGGIFTAQLSPVSASTAAWSLRYSGRYDWGVHNTWDSNAGCAWAITLHGHLLRQNPAICDNSRIAVASAKRSLKRHQKLAARHRKHKSIRRLRALVIKRQKLAATRCAAE